MCGIVSSCELCGGLADSLKAIPVVGEDGEPICCECGCSVEMSLCSKCIEDNNVKDTLTMRKHVCKPLVS